MVVGLMRYVCVSDGTKTVDVMITKCTDMQLSAVASYLGKLDEWPDEIMLERMRRHYPEINLTDTVQVVEHSAPLHGN